MQLNPRVNYAYQIQFTIANFEPITMRVKLAPALIVDTDYGWKNGPDFFVNNFFVTSPIEGGVKM